MSFLLRILRQIPPLLTGLVQSLLPCTPRSLTRNDSSSEDLVIGGHSVHLREESGLARDRRLVTISMLPDDVFLIIFNFYIDNTHRYELENTWHALVHVCHRWRHVVFAPPRRLNLRVEYSAYRPISEELEAWPTLPVILRPILVILPSGLLHPMSVQRWDNTVAALKSEHYDRICEIYIPNLTNSLWESFSAAMQKPFPELTHLEVFVVRDDVVPALPDSFLGGSAPRLRELTLRNVPLPSMPKLLLSANGLLTLNLGSIPDSGYISPDAMATALTVMTRLEILHLRFRSPGSRPDPESRSLPSHPRFVLPALTKLTFGGVYEYLEDLLARIDAPLLEYLLIIFFMDLDFDVPQLRRLIGHAEQFKKFDYGAVLIFGDSIWLDLHPKTEVGAVNHRRLLGLQINCRELDWQLSSLAQVCGPSLPLISALEELEIRESKSLPSSHWKDDMEDTQWLELLDPFTALKSLYVTDKIARRVCAALQGLSGENAIEVLPALRNLFVDGYRSFEHIQETIKPFAAARQHPMVVERWTD